MRHHRLRTAAGRVTAAVVLAVGAPAHAYVFDLNASGEVRRWSLENPDDRVRTTSVNRSTRAIIYRLDPAGYSATNTAAELDAVRTAFDLWQQVPGTRVRFEEGPGIPGVEDVNSSDHVNSVFWARTALVNGGRDSVRGVLGLTYVASFRDGNVIFDADTVFNAVDFTWFTDFSDPTTQKVFVEAIALHEAGHLLGLQHSPVGGATMLVGGEYGVNAQVGLAIDDRAAAWGLYPDSDRSRQVGRVNGRVMAGGQPVFGAAVFAENPLGEVFAGTVTTSEGRYELGGLPAGGYTVRVAPLDPATSLNYLIRGLDISTAYGGAQTLFSPSDDRPVTVNAGGGTGNVDFEVFGGAPPRVARVMKPAANLNAPTYSSYPVSLVPDGQRRYLGVLTTARASTDLRLEITGNDFEAGPVEVRTNALPGLNLVALPVVFATNATPGLRSLRLWNGSQFGWAHGFLEVLPPFPDINGDGLDDRFQRTYWTRFTQPAAAPGADPDNDGFDNAWEHRTGSVPTDPASARFEIQSVRVTEAGSVIRSEAAPGRRFQLWGREVVGDAPWEEVGGPVTAAAQSVEFTDPTSTRSVRFYRVELVP